MSYPLVYKGGGILQRMSANEFADFATVVLNTFASTDGPGSIYTPANVTANATVIGTFYDVFLSGNVGEPSPVQYIDLDTEYDLVYTKTDIYDIAYTQEPVYTGITPTTPYTINYAAGLYTLSYTGTYTDIFTQTTTYDTLYAGVEDYLIAYTSAPTSYTLDYTGFTNFTNQVIYTLITAPAYTTDTGVYYTATGTAEYTITGTANYTNPYFTAIDVTPYATYYAEDIVYSLNASTVYYSVLESTYSGPTPNSQNYTLLGEASYTGASFNVPYTGPGDTVYLTDIPDSTAYSGPALDNYTGATFGVLYTGDGAQIEYIAPGTIYYTGTAQVSYTTNVPDTLAYTGVTPAAYTGATFNVQYTGPGSIVYTTDVPDSSIYAGTAIYLGPTPDGQVFTSGDIYTGPGDATYAVSFATYTAITPSALYTGPGNSYDISYLSDLVYTGPSTYDSDFSTFYTVTGDVAYTNNLQNLYTGLQTDLYEGGVDYAGVGTFTVNYTAVPEYNGTYNTAIDYTIAYTSPIPSTYTGQESNGPVYTAEVVSYTIEPAYSINYTMEFTSLYTTEYTDTTYTNDYTRESFLNLVYYTNFFTALYTEDIIYTGEDYIGPGLYVGPLPVTTYFSGTSYFTGPGAPTNYTGGGKYFTVFTGPGPAQGYTSTVTYTGTGTQPDLAVYTGPDVVYNRESAPTFLFSGPGAVYTGSNAQTYDTILSYDGPGITFNDTFTGIYTDTIYTGNYTTYFNRNYTITFGAPVAYTSIYSQTYTGAILYSESTTYDGYTGSIFFTDFPAYEQIYTIDGPFGYTQEPEYTQSYTIEPQYTLTYVGLNTPYTSFDLYQDLTNPTGDDPPAAVFYNTSTVPLKLKLNELADEILSYGVVNNGPGSYVLSDSSPVDGGVWVTVGTLMQKNDLTSTTTKTLYKKISSGWTPEIHRPLKHAGNGVLKRFSDVEISRLAKTVRQRIVDTGVGQYVLANAAPVVGTWVNTGSLTDSYANVAPGVYLQTYVSDYNATYIAPKLYQIGASYTLTTYLGDPYTIILEYAGSPTNIPYTGPGGNYNGPSTYTLNNYYTNVGAYNVTTLYYSQDIFTNSYLGDTFDLPGNIVTYNNVYNTFINDYTGASYTQTNGFFTEASYNSYNSPTNYDHTGYTTVEYTGSSYTKDPVYSALTAAYTGDVNALIYAGSPTNAVQYTNEPGYAGPGGTYEGPVYYTGPTSYSLSQTYEKESTYSNSSYTNLINYTATFVASNYDGVSVYQSFDSTVSNLYVAEGTYTDQYGATLVNYSLATDYTSDNYSTVYTLEILEYNSAFINSQSDYAAAYDTLIDSYTNVYSADVYIASTDLSYGISYNSYTTVNQAYEGAGISYTTDYFNNIVYNTLYAVFYAGNEVSYDNAYTGLEVIINQYTQTVFAGPYLNTFAASYGTNYTGYFNAIYQIDYIGAGINYSGALVYANTIRYDSASYAEEILYEGGTSIDYIGQSNNYIAPIIFTDDSAYIGGGPSYDLEYTGADVINNNVDIYDDYILWRRVA